MPTSVSQLNISGMHCASCAQLIKKSLTSVPGVEDVSVNYATKKATIKYNPELSTISDLKSKIQSAGYQVSLTPSNDLQDSLVWRRKFIFSLILTLPILFSMFFALPGIFWIALILTTLNLLFVGRNFYLGFFTALKLKTFTMDSLIAIGTFSAYVFSLIMGTYHYFEVASSLITFVTLGKWLESLAKAKTSSAISKLVDLSPKIIHLKSKDGFTDIGLQLAKINDIVIVKPGETIPLDGLIVSGTSSVNQAALTGESLPVDKKTGDQVFAGTQNLNGSFEFKITADSSNTILSRIIKLVEEAQSTRSPLQDFADKISSIFVPLVLLLAVVTFIIWYFFLNASLDVSVTYFLAVIVIACPCALGLAIPTVVMVATGLTAKFGILVKGGDSLQKAATISTIVFDKTGTLTLGLPQITSFKNISNFPDSKIINIVYSLELKSEHPIAKAFIEFAKKHQPHLIKLRSFKSITGFGVEAKSNLATYTLGKSTNGSIELKRNRHSLAEFTVLDTIKPESPSVIKSLQSLGLDVYLVTGDHQSNAIPIAAQLGIKADHVFADTLPDQKVEIVKKLQNSLPRNGGVAFVGDGINDSPSLAQADLGIALGSGTDIAIESGNVVIMNNKLDNILVLRQISQKTVSKINQNFFYALVYNLVFIPVAAGLFSPFGINLRPEFAALAMSLSSISVVLNSLLLNRFRQSYTI